MTKNLFLALLGLVLLASCQSVDLSEYLDEGESGCELTFCLGKYSIEDFDDSDSESSSSKASTRSKKTAGELGSVVNFAVYSGGEKIKTVNQKSSDEDFGKVKVTLPVGNYSVVALIHSGNGNATMTSTEKIAFSNNKITDTFSHFSTIDVSDNATVDLSLERVVSKFRLTIEDEIPADVAQMKFYYTGGSSTLNAETGFGCVNSRQTELRDVTNHSAGQVFEVYTFPHEESDILSMTITALDTSGTEYAIRTLENIPVEYQKVTKTSMVFFDGSATSSAQGAYSLYGDDEWKGELDY